jgi:hypothetical protein
MSYTIQNDWQRKDALDAASAGKVISGTHFYNDFVAIQNEFNNTAKKAGDSNQSFEALTPDVADDTTKVATTEYITTALADYTTTSTIDADMATLVDMATHADLRSSEDVFGHAKIWVDGTTLNITTS